MSDVGYGDFEFERRFVVRDLPVEILDTPTLILQSYYLASDGYGLRVRVQAPESSVDLSDLDSPEAELEYLRRHQDLFEFAAVTVKGPVIAGTRYEAERELDVMTAIELVLRGGNRILKHRHSAWLGEDGWVIDVFGGANQGLIIAEVERGGPVVDLAIPAFCYSEITEDPRFTNDSLSQRPFSTWAAVYEQQLRANGPVFMKQLGINRHQR